MNTITEIATAAQDQVFEAMKQGQDIVIEGVRTWTETVGGLLPKLPAFDSPWADQLPTVPESAGLALGLAERTLASQRRLVEGLIEATAPGRDSRTPSPKRTASSTKA